MPLPLFAHDGGLMAYGPDLIDLYRQCGVMVGRILKGARPEEIPVERPNQFRLVLNLKTAKALGLTIRRRCWRGRIR
jgi:putative ABC transport system substrate-binding protein